MTSARSQPRPPALAWGEGSLRLAEAVRAQQGHLQAAVARLDAAGIEDVHQGRVAARRLRSVLKTFGPLVDARWARLYRMDLRSFAHGLAPVREADVHGEILRRLVEGEGQLASAGLARLNGALRAARSDVRERLQRRSREHTWKSLLKALAARSEQSPRIARVAASQADLLELALAAWRKPIRRMRRHPEDADDLHELRLALKHCRYALEVVADVEPRCANLLLRRLRRAQETIGAHRDTMAAAHWVRCHERTLGRTTALQIDALLARRELALRRAAARQCDKLLPVYEDWRAALRPLRKAARSRRA